MVLTTPGCVQWLISGLQAKEEYTHRFLDDCLSSRKECNIKFLAHQRQRVNVPQATEKLRIFCDLAIGSGHSLSSL